MNLETKRYTVEAIRESTKRAQHDAADPRNSAWVNANAGTGKTHVLTMRVLRLLLAGTKPERILCLTYTKAAAAEMSKRVFERLAGWVTADEASLRADLLTVAGGSFSDAVVKHARTLFATAIETPGGLKVQTIHAFAERLLQRFPLEAGVPPGFNILDEQQARDLKVQAIEATLTEATGTPLSSLGRALDFIVRYATDAHFDKLISAALEEHRWLDAHSAEEGGTLGDLSAVEKGLRQSLCVRAAVASADLHTECAEVLSQPELEEICTVLASGSKQDVEFAQILRSALEQKDPQRRAELLAKFFLTGEGEPRARLMTAKLSDQRSDLHERCKRAQAEFLAIFKELKALMLIEASLALYEVAGAVLSRYADARSAAGALDFDDLILKTTALLSGADDAAQWVLYKLDGGLDHILVDEAQDTSSEQWDIIANLAADFFANMDGVPRTIFAVGDEKQSIYSFQGAAPQMFAKTGERFAQLCSSASLSWRRVPLNLSFRTVAPILTAVDKVFRDPDRTPGIAAEIDSVLHVADRAGDAGLVEIWPTEKCDETADADPWSPLLDTSEASPANRLAECIAETIARWLETKERLASEDRPIEPGDILILVRKRHPFAVPMVAALKRRSIAVAGSDRIVLTDQIAVQDLMVLGDFLTLPEDDLALATVLKGPIFGFDDDDLLAIAPGRKRTLWTALLDSAETNAAYRYTAETLKRWRAKADFTPPFEFFSSVLDRDGGREKMLQRLGPEAADAIDEFLDFALAYDEITPPSLTQFLARIRAAAPEIKRDMEDGRGEVRVMTVHGAKGLEAPIVFLPDTCTTASGDIAGSAILKVQMGDDPSASPQRLLWTIKGTSRVPIAEDARAARETRDREERNRLLYVAMTRARDRLYVAGFEGKRGRVPGCWYDLVCGALTPSLAEVDLGDGRKGWRIEAPQVAAPDTRRGSQAQVQAEGERPEFATRRAAPEPKLSVPLAPSRLEPYAPDAEGEPLMRSRREPAATNDGPSPRWNAENRFLRGTLTHALLQYLPNIAEADRARVTNGFIEKRGEALSAPVRASIAAETLAILSDPRYAVLFGPGSMAEVPIAAVIPRPRGSGPALDLSGQIDRLAVTDREVLIVDYKTNRPPPSDVKFVADAYLFQLAAYRLALTEIYPNRRVRAALLWTDGPRLMDIGDDVLDRFTDRLWDLDVRSLDAP